MNLPPAASFVIGNFTVWQVCEKQSLMQSTMLRFFLFFLFPSMLAVTLSAQEYNLDAIDVLVPPTDTVVDTENAVSETTKTEVPVAQTPATETQADLPTPPKNAGLFAIIHAGGLIGYMIILLSFVSVALMIEHGLAIRKAVMMPPGFSEEVLALLSQGQLAAAIKTCETNPSTLAKILHAGMTEYELGWGGVEKGAEEATAEEASRLYRKIEYLNVIGNIAPMLGLLGTVVGMVFAFQQLAESEGFARATELAEGIYLALVTTVEGLIVAIPSLAAFSIFSNRIAFLIAETTFTAEQVLLPIKKSLVRKRNS